MALRKREERKRNKEVGRVRDVNTRKCKGKVEEIQNKKKREKQNLE